MSDEIALLLILAGLHLMESCQVVPHGTVVFRAAWLTRYTAMRAAELMRVSRGRFIFLNPVDARAHAFAAGLPHLLPTAEGVLDVAPEEDNAPRRRPFVRWSSLGEVRASESSIVCSALGTIECGSPRVARVWARVLNAHRTAPPARRSTLADRWLRARFAPVNARRRMERVERVCRALERISLVGFGATVAGAIVVAQRTSEAILLGFLGIGVLSGFVTAIATWRAHARLEPRDGSSRLGRALMITVCFPVAFRARASLGRDALGLMHPAAAAAAGLLSSKAAREFLGATLRRWRHRSAPPPAGSDDQIQLAAAAEVVAKQILAAARKLDLDEPVLNAPPRLDDPSIQSWCPRCHATYVHASGTCTDCPGVPLRPARR